MNEKLRAAGFDLPYIPPVKDMDKKEFKGALIFATGSVLNTSRLKRFEPYATGYCSGWMARTRTSVVYGYTT